MSVTLKQALPYAQRFLEFVNAAVTPFHAVAECKKRLVQSGYQQLVEKDFWKIEKNGKYFFTRNSTTIVAFTVGGQFVPGNGFKIIGAHTDSPDLRLRPLSAASKSGFLQVGVQTYGGGLWHTWFDRDLTVAGRVMVQKSEDEANPRFEEALVKINRPILRIPNLAIHLDRDVANGFKVNNENHLVPVLATAIQAKLLGQESPSEARHHSGLVNLLAEELGCKAEQIVDLDLSIVDTQPSCLGGVHEEFIFSPRLDNLLSCYVALEALLNTDSSVANDGDVRIVALFDHEEIGSSSAQGAGSSLMRDLIERLTKLLNSGENVPVDAFNATISKSFIISSDMAHAVHPNYSDKHQEKHRPEIHKGPVIKTNANQRYATSAATALIIKELARRASVPFQDFVVRNDMGCGSTIGPILASNCGIRTVDLGNPQLSMHSIREMCGTIDLAYAVKLYEEFFANFREVDNTIA